MNEPSRLHAHSGASRPGGLAAAPLIGLLLVTVAAALWATVGVAVGLMDNAKALSPDTDPDRPDVKTTDSFNRNGDPLPELSPAARTLSLRLRRGA